LATAPVWLTAEPPAKGAVRHLELPGDLKPSVRNLMDASGGSPGAVGGLTSHVFADDGRLEPGCRGRVVRRTGDRFVVSVTLAARRSGRSRTG
jgi:hypothetical protein